MQDTPTEDRIHAALETAAEAVDRAQAARKRYRRRKTPTRGEKLAAARDACACAAEPLRSYIGMVAWHDIPYEQESGMKRMIESLRYERRQLDKML